MLIGGNKKNSAILSIAMGVLFLTGCHTQEETAEKHLDKGKELFEKGEYDKAILELKTSSQAEDQRGDTYYYMALLDEKTNNFKSMKQNLLRTLELDANHLEARQKLGKIHLLFGDLDKALEQAEFILTKKPDDANARLLKASVYMSQSKRNEAAEIVDNVLKVEQKNIDALSLKAALHFDADDFDKALDTINIALAIDNKNLPLRLFKIKIYAKKNNIDGVISDYKELINIYPDAENFKLSLASIYSMTDKLDLAEILLRDIVEKYKDKLEPKISLLEFLNAKVKDRVVPEFDKMVTNAGQQSPVILELSKWMLASGYGDAAANGLKKVADLERNSNIGLTAQTILAEIALNNKQLAEVENTLNAILQVNSDFVDANLLKSRLLLTQNKVDEAIELLNKVVWTKNDSDNAYMLLGQAYTLKRDQKQADKNFKQALDLNPANLGAFVPVYGSYLQANQKETARQYLDKALKAKPNQFTLLSTKADLDIAEKKWDDAQDVVQKITLFSKNKAVPKYLQANILQGRGKYSEAAAMYEALLAEFPDHLNSMVNLARCYEALKLRHKALSFLEAHHDKNKDDLNVVGVLADIYVADKDYLKAKDLLSKQIKQTPAKSVSLYLALAKIEAAIRKSSDGARDIYLKGLENNPDDPQLSMALAGLYEQTGNKVGARKLYEDLLVKNPDIDLAVNNLASLLIESEKEEDVAKGVQLAEKFKDADNPYYQDTYAWGLVKSGKLSEGLAILESLIVKEPKVPEIRYHLGVGHYKNANRATAISEIKQAMSLSEKQQRDFVGKEDAQKLLKDLSR